MAEVDRTLLLVKPDGVRRGLVGEILGRIERSGLAIIGLSMCHVTEDFVRGHYAGDDRQLRQMGQKLCAAEDKHGLSLIDKFGTADPVELGRIIFERNVHFLASGPVVAAVLQGFNAAHKARLICGTTLPRDAAPGTIRGDLSSVGVEQVIDAGLTVCNLVHASDPADGLDAPEREIAYWFPSEDTFESSPPLWSALVEKARECQEPRRV